MNALQLATLSLSAVALCACASSAPRPTLAPLVDHGAPDFEYDTQVTGVGELEKWVADVQPPLDESAQLVEVRCDILRMSTDAARRLVGWEFGPRVWMTSTDGLSQVFHTAAGDPRASVLSGPILSVFAGQRGSVSVTNQVAYIRGFAVEYSGAMSVADPRVDVAHDGITMEVLAEFVEDSDTPVIDLALRVAHLQRPFPQVEVSIPGASLPVTIQQPIASVQKITTRTPLDVGDCLVLVANAPEEPGDFLFVFVRAAAFERPAPQSEDN